MDWSTITSSISAGLAILLFLQSPQANSVLPHEFYTYVRRWLRRIGAFFSNYIYFTVDEYDGFNPNELYTAVQLHLSDAAAEAARSARLSLPKNASAATCTISDNERVVDTLPDGTRVWWEFLTSERRNAPLFSWHDLPDEKRSLQMCIHKRHRPKIFSDYIPGLRRNADILRLQRRERLLFTNMKSSSQEWRRSSKVWDSVPFKHPSTFETLALDPDRKDFIKNDLLDFAKGEAFYKRVGRAWKRGYLLYGPPGTGKSSMIAAMANLLEYDVYDLELTEVKSNCHLRSLLLKTNNRSIIVIEDIDCSLDLTDERKKKGIKKAKDDDKSNPVQKSDDDQRSMVTLSGLLNFTDGLWSCCGSERIFVFTTNHIEKLDKALLRAGRMDVHIELSYCTFEAFKVLANNYLYLESDHEMFEQVQAAMEEEGAQMTPAEVSECLTREKHNVEAALSLLISELKVSNLKRQAEREEEERKRKEREKMDEEEEQKQNKDKKDDPAKDVQGNAKNPEEPNGDCNHVL